MSATNLQFIYGNNDYLRQEKITQFWCGALQKYGDFNVSKLVFAPEKLQEISAEMLTPPMFGNGRRVIFLHNFPPAPVGGKTNDKQKIASAEMLKLLTKQLPDEVAVICVADKVDKRTAAFKSLSKIAQVTEFAAWQPDRFGKLPAAATAFVRKRLNCTASLAQQLIDFVGSDGFTLHNETLKLALYSHATNQPITGELIKKLCLPSNTVRAFALSNALQTGDSRRIAAQLDELFVSGESPMAIFLRDVVPAVRQLLLASFANDAAAAGLHPFVFKNWKPLADRIPQARLRTAHAELLRIDVDSKQGLLPPIASQWQWRILAVLTKLLPTR